MISDLFDRLMRLHHIPRWLAAFFVVAGISAAAFCLLTAPLLLAGFPLSSMALGAIGCGIGTAVIHATLIALA